MAQGSSDTIWWRSGSRFGSGSPKSEIRILRIGGGLCSLSISSFSLQCSESSKFQRRAILNKTRVYQPQSMDRAPLSDWQRENGILTPNCMQGWKTRENVSKWSPQNSLTLSEKKQGHILTQHNNGGVEGVSTPTGKQGQTDRRDDSKSRLTTCYAFK